MRNSDVVKYSQLVITVTFISFRPTLSKRDELDPELARCIEFLRKEIKKVLTEQGVFENSSNQLLVRGILVLF